MLLRKLRKGQTGGIANIVIGIIVLMMVIWAAVLIGGVFSKSVSNIFTQLGVSSNWTNIFTQAQSYALTGVQLLAITLILVAVSALVAIIIRVFRPD